MILERMWLCCEIGEQQQGSRYSRQIEAGRACSNSLWDLILSEWGREDGDRYGLHDTDSPYKLKFTEPNFTSQPAGDGSVLSPAGFRSALIHTQQVLPHTRHSNSSDITLLYGVLDQLGPFNSQSYF